MNGRQHRPRPGQAQVETDDVDDVQAGALTLTDPRLTDATRQWFALLSVSDSSYEHQTATARACAKVWAIRAELLADAGKHDAARKAASTANEQSSLAVKLDMSAVVDRVTALEAMLRQSRNDATRLGTLK